MIDAQKINFSELPKRFCDGAMAAYNKESFFFAMISGNNLDAFATTPRIMKDIAMFLDKHIQDYEKQFGEIDMNMPEIKSPIQRNDLGGSKKK